MLQKYLLFIRRISTTNSIKSPVRNSLNIAFGKYLFLTNTISSGGLMLLGDLVQQEFEYQQKKLEKRYDYGRLCRMFLTGLGMGPVHHYYYVYLNQWMPQRDLVTITKKILLDQFVMSPICIAQFFYSIGLLERKSIRQCNEEMSNKFINVYMVDWCIWPPTQFLNFLFIPVKYQVLYINAVTMIYNIFLSYIKHKRSTSKDN